jgi:poly(A) polymerase Pap1
MQTTMNKSTTVEFQEALQPIMSLISKSEKARQKLTPGTWQHTMLQENLRALHIASALMNGKANDADVLTRDDFQDALRAFAAMTSRCEEARAKFEPGTSQHTLQRNRLRAFRTAEALIRMKLK